MRLTINGEDKIYEDALTVEILLGKIGLDSKKAAVERNPVSLQMTESMSLEERKVRRERRKKEGFFVNCLKFGSLSGRGKVITS